MSDIVWDARKEILKMWHIKELEYLSKRGAFYNFLTEDQKVVHDIISDLAKAELEDIEIRKYRDMWE